MDSAMRMMIVSMLMAGAIAGVPALAAPLAAPPDAGACAFPFDPARPLPDRVGAPSADILEVYALSGAKDAKPHDITDAEWTKLDAAIAALPDLHRTILQRHLRRIGVVDTPPGAGNALMSPAEPSCGSELFDITFRAGLFDESLTTFLNGKEAGLFEAVGTGGSVHIEAGELNALTYILLHEATHIVDGVLDISTDDSAAFRSGVWKPGEDRVLLPPYVTNPINSILWRGGEKVPVSRAAEVYEGLSQTPFVSLYASASVGEDFAETVAWHHLATRLEVELLIEVRRADGHVDFRYAPLRSAKVRERFLAIEPLLEQK